MTTDGAWLASGGTGGTKRLWSSGTPADPARPDVQHGVLAEADSQLRQLADQLSQAEDQLVGLTGMDPDVRTQCQHVVADLSQQVLQLWAVLSEFQGADLRAAIDVSIDDLDGVLWSDTTAIGGPTVWPEHVRLLVKEHSMPAGAEPGVFVVQFGAAISIAR